MATRLERGIRIFLLLQNGLPHDAIQLAEKMGVTRRTIFRDMALLKEMGLPVSYDPRSACYSYDTTSSDYQDKQFRIEANQLRDFLVSIAASASGDLSEDDQDNLREQVVAFASRLPRPMRANVKATIKAGDASEKSESCRKRQMLVAIERAILGRQSIRLTSIDPQQHSSDDEPNSLMVIPLELHCTIDGWALTAINSEEESSFAGETAATDANVATFSLQEYKVTSTERATDSTNK